MVTDNLLEFLNDFQKFALKIKIQQILDTMVKDDRVHEVIDADKVFDYYNKMYEEFAKNPHNFLFPNREWLWDSLKRLNVDLSNVFDAGATDTCSHIHLWYNLCYNCSKQTTWVL